MKPLLLSVLFTAASFTAAPISFAREAPYAPLEFKPRAVVNDDDTKRALELLHDLPTISPAEASARLEQILKDKDLPRSSAGPWFDLLAKVGGPRELQQLYIGVVTSLPDDCCEGGRGPDFDPTFAYRDENDLRLAAQTLLQAAQTRGVRPASPYQDGRLHFGSHVYWQCPDGMSGTLTRLAGLFKVVEDYDRIANQLGHATTHYDAYAGLLLGAGQEVVEAVEPLCVALDSDLSARGALLILARVEPAVALKYVNRVLSAPMEDDELLRLWSDLLAVPPFAEKLTAALPWYLPPHVRALGEKAARARQLDALAQKLTPGEDSVLPPSEFSGMAAKLAAQGDAARGERVFRGEAAACASCHGLGGVGPGPESGPDLGRIGAQKDLAEILCDTLQPGARITKGYELYGAPTADQTVYAGTKDTFTERMYTCSMTPLEKGATWPPKGGAPFAGSAMPAGLTDALTAQEKADLFAFLAKLGQPGGLEAGDLHAARSWRIESEVQDHPENFINREDPTGGTSSVLSLINGELPKSDMLDALYSMDRKRAFYLGTTFRSKTAGKAHFSFTGAQQIWLDGKSITPNPEGACDVELTTGRHRLDLRLVPERLAERVRAASPDVEFGAGWIESRAR